MEAHTYIYMGIAHPLVGVVRRAIVRPKVHVQDSPEKARARPSASLVVTAVAAVAMAVVEMYRWWW